MTDASGEVYQHLEYFAFGETFVEEHSNTDRTPYLYNGKELDEETGLYYYGARYYDVRTSVFISVDPLAEKYPGWSPYNYTLNNPINLIDPTGLSPEDGGDKATQKQEIKTRRGMIKELRQGKSSEGKRSMIKDLRAEIRRIKRTGEVGVSGYNLPGENDFNTHPVSTTTGLAMSVGTVGGGGTSPGTVTTTTPLESARNEDGSLKWRDSYTPDAIKGTNLGPYPVSSTGENSLEVEFWPTSPNSIVQIWDVSNPSNPNQLGSNIQGGENGMAVNPGKISIPNGVTNIQVQIWGNSDSGRGGNSGYYAIGIKLINSQSKANTPTIKTLTVKN
jgi:RHS repeat-associated protein